LLLRHFLVLAESLLVSSVIWAAFLTSLAGAIALTVRQVVSPHLQDCRRVSSVLKGSFLLHPLRLVVAFAALVPTLRWGDRTSARNAIEDFTRR